MEQTQEEPLFYSVPDAAKRLSIGSSTLYDLINAGKFPVTRIGKRMLVSRLYLEKLAQPPDNATPTH